MPKSRFITFLRFFRRRQGLIFRALFCWVIALFILSTDEKSSFDFRFQIRGEQATTSKLILVQIDAYDLSRSHPLMKKIKDYSSVPQLDLLGNADTVFWDRELWRELLQRILIGSPKKVGVSLFFDERIPKNSFTESDKKVFLDSRIVWSSLVGEFDQINNSVFASSDLSNIGDHDLKRDDDGIVRRLPPEVYGIPHLVERLVSADFPDSHYSAINYRTQGESFRSYSLTQVLDPLFPLAIFKDAYVIVGSKVGSDGKILTPLGIMSRTEIFAQIADNLIENRWIKKFNFGIYAGFLLLLLGFATFVITKYPQTVSLIVFIWLGTLWAALSAWFFDSFYIWVPAFTPFLLLILVWIVFIGYQATKIERQHFQLQQEQKALRELEQLKNNFVSLISHDLKTPLAKIEAISQRLIHHPETIGFRKDLDALKECSDELNHYIQSVLKLLRVESRDFRIHPESSDINELISEALQQVAPLAREKEISITHDLEPMFLAEFDPILIKEVIVNLLDNAIKYTPREGNVRVISRELNDQDLSFIEVSVEDSGEGISQQEVDQVWNKFVRGREQEMKTKGTGLGLYLVKYFVELHGGKVQMESEINRGTQVKFSLPLQIANPTQENEVKT